MIVECWNETPSARPAMTDILARMDEMNADRRLEPASNWNDPVFTRPGVDIEHPTTVQADELVSPRNALLQQAALPAIAVQIFDKVDFFRLGINHKQCDKYEESLQCFDYILRNPNKTYVQKTDIWCQMGYVYEQKEYDQAKSVYECALSENSEHAKVLQQLGWLYHQNECSFQNHDLAIQYLDRSVEADSSDTLSWYLLGRVYSGPLRKCSKAYEAYQQAVYRDGRNPASWCSIGALYFQTNQFRDALDAYSRAIRIDPFMPEVWFNLGLLYECCNDQISDAIDSYARALELDPGNAMISERLESLRQALATGGQVSTASELPNCLHPKADVDPLVPMNLQKPADPPEEDAVASSSLQSTGQKAEHDPLGVTSQADNLGDCSTNAVTTGYRTRLTCAQALELDPGNAMINGKLELLRQALAMGGQVSGSELPKYFHPKVGVDPLVPMNLQKPVDPSESGEDAVASFSSQSTGQRAEQDPLEAASQAESRGSPWERDG
ncbi:TPR-like protein [Marasmius fiardii PR-910]|nr:TPR-like protein [Marasmius fiardii PR-910]